MVDGKRQIRFGTDGVRGIANQTLRAGDVLRLGISYGRYILSRKDRRPLVMGRDPRQSSAMFSAAFQAGMCSAGLDVLDAGTLSSPALAFLAGHLDVSGGVMISASHNPSHYNGVKLFDEHGQKLTAVVELEIEELTASLDDSILASPTEVGQMRVLNSPLDAYLESLRSSIDGLTLDGLAVAIDTANGAASAYSAEILREFGVDVLSHNHDPNGSNINANCGATHPEALRGIVLSTGVDVGICLDGDADRVVLLDERGRVLDGDFVKFIWTNHAQATGRLKNRTVVGTLMSNLGLEHALAGIGCDLVRTLVGDRYVYERMQEMGAVIGGEQSGHIIFRDFARTGDGLLTALQILAVMKSSGQRLSKLAEPMKKLPQVLKNVPIEPGCEWRTKAVVDAVSVWEERLSDSGRIVLRESGTEPLLRIMCECAEERLAHEVVEDLARTLVSVRQLARSTGRPKE